MMSPKRVKLTRQELEEHLQEQLPFLEASAYPYDDGLDGEAKRLAVTLRVLLHDAGRSRSLLGQLDRLSGSFMSTAFPVVPGNKMSHSGLAMIGMSGQDTKYLAMLDDVPFTRWVSFKEWWSEIVFVDDERRELARSDLITVAANQDGGAHVDPALDATYHALSKRNSMGWRYSDGEVSTPIPFPERASIRQIAHEVLGTLHVGYKKRVEHQVDIISGGAMMLNASESPPMPRQAAVGRNDPCPCGSGVKYKRCHGRISRS